MEVGLTGNDRQHVTVRTREENPILTDILGFRPRVGEQLSELRDECLDALGRTRRPSRTPEVLHDLVDRYDLIGAQQELGEQGALLMPAKRERSPVVVDLERPQDAEIHACFRSLRVESSTGDDLRTSRGSSRAPTGRLTDSLPLPTAESDDRLETPKTHRTSFRRRSREEGT